MYHASEARFLARINFHARSLFNLELRIAIENASFYLCAPINETFSEINVFTSRLLSLLKTTNYTGQAVLEQISKKSCHPAPEVVMQGGLAIMHDLRARGVLLGVKCE